MELTRLQEEILICLTYFGELCESEILEKLNDERAKDWKQISQPLLNKTLSRCLELELIQQSRIDKENYNKKYYKPTDTGFWSVLQAADNRKRLGDPRIVPVSVLE